MTLRGNHLRISGVRGSVNRTHYCSVSGIGILRSSGSIGGSGSGGSSGSSGSGVKQLALASPLFGCTNVPPTRPSNSSDFYRSPQRAERGGGGGSGGLLWPFAPHGPSSFEAPRHRPPEIVTLATRQQAIITLASRHQTFSSFDDLIHSSDLVLVDFYATWCGPCKHMAGVLQSLSHRLLASVKIVKIDTEKYPALASQYGITALPTIVLFRHGSPVDRIEGILPPEELILRLSSLLAPSHTH
ncbi:unnamed protein product [Closterium sp. NIES-64]|nr:unnamed protein product [Closterium sp. NIES-65]CAI5980394.1 unnamed protein product [Closterium sp. NIES-64]